MCLIPVFLLCSYLHAKSIIHRDLKSNSILFLKPMPVPCQRALLSLHYHLAAIFPGYIDITDSYVIIYTNMLKSIRTSEHFLDLFS